MFPKEKLKNRNMQSLEGPMVPGCCCRMPDGAKVVGIIEIVFSGLQVAFGFYSVITRGSSLSKLVFLFIFLFYYDSKL